MELFFILSDIHDIFRVLPEPAVTPLCHNGVHVCGPYGVRLTHTSVSSSLTLARIRGYERNWSIRMHIKTRVYIHINFHPMC